MPLAPVRKFKVGRLLVFIVQVARIISGPRIDVNGAGADCPGTVPSSPLLALQLRLLVGGEVVAQLVLVLHAVGLQSTFDIRFMLSSGFAWRVAAITAASTAPIWLGKLCAHYCAPQVVTKLA